MIAGAIGSGIYAYSRFNEAFLQARWSPVIGIVQSASVVGTRAIRPNIVYQYRYDEMTYVDSSWLSMASFGGRNSRRSTAKTLIHDFLPGDSIVVRVNPSNPRESTLQTHPHWSAYGSAGFALVLLAAATVSIWFARRQASRLFSF